MADPELLPGASGRDVQSEVRARVRRPGMILLIVAVGFALPATLTALTRLIRITTVGNAALLGIALLVLAAGVIALRRTLAAAIAAAYLRNGYCPACAHPLASRPPAAAGVQMVCPHCSAAWRIP